MKRILSAVGLAACCLTWTAPASTQPIPDHLKCYKVKDPQAKTTYTADLTGLAPEPGCVIKVPAKLLCVDATKTNVHPSPPGGGPSGRDAGMFLCYPLKCPRAKLVPVPVVDQFGSRTVAPNTPPLLCAPAGPPTTSTTTTTTSTSTTRPTMPVCGTPDAFGFCGGPCPSGMTCAATSSTGCGCVPNDQLCHLVGAFSCAGACPHVTDVCFGAGGPTTFFCGCATPCGASGLQCSVPPVCPPGVSCVPLIGDACACQF